MSPYNYINVPAHSVCNGFLQESVKGSRNDEGGSRTVHKLAYRIFSRGCSVIVAEQST